MSHHDGGTELTRTYDTAVVLHLFYPDLWDELRTYLANFGDDYDLYLTIPRELELADDALRAAVPTVRICRVENRGRDIGPFLTVLTRIAPLGYRYICKIHTKKSMHFSGGERWRRDLLTKLIGSADAIDRIREAMDAQPDLGLISPAGHTLPLRRDSYYWFANRRGVRELARAAGIPFERYEADGFTFAAGSMFWFRPEALDPALRAAAICEPFEPESGQQDGTLAHAFERFFGLSALHAGFSIAEVQNAMVEPAETPVQVQLLLESTRGLLRQLARQSTIQTLRDRHRGQTAWIIGCGPSLIMLRREDIGDGPVIAINDAITVVERFNPGNPLYSMQKGAEASGVGPVVVTPGQDTFVPIQHATLLVEANGAPDRLSDYRPRYVFDSVADFSLASSEVSALVGAAIASMMGCARVVYLCHDAFVSGDTRPCTPHEDGSFVVGLESDSDEVSVQHRERIEAYLTQMRIPTEWVTPATHSDELTASGQVVENLRSTNAELQQLIAQMRADLDRRTAEAQTLRDEVEKLAREGACRQQDLERLQSDVEARSAESRRLSDAVADFMPEVAQLRAALAESDDRTRRQLEEARGQIETLTRERDTASAYVDALLSSASWRWMTPLRMANRVLMRRKR